MVIVQIEKEDLAGMIEAAVKKAVLENFQGLGAGSEEDRLMTVEEAAEFLRCKVSTIYDNVCKGNLPHMKRAKRLYFSKSELTGYLKEGRRKTNHEIMAEADAYTNRKK
jgi:excisionase family DNA binding protein